MESKVAKRYARAIFHSAETTDSVNVVEEELGMLAALADSQGAFRSFLRNPKIGRDQKIAILQQNFQGKLNGLTLAAMELLLKKGREAELRNVERDFVEIRREKSKVIYAKIASAQEMDEKARAALVANLEKRIGKKLEPAFVVDNELIGGVRVSYENMVLDGSVKGSLDRLRRTLEYDVLRQV